MVANGLPSISTHRPYVVESLEEMVTSHSDNFTADGLRSIQRKSGRIRRADLDQDKTKPSVYSQDTSHRIDLETKTEFPCLQGRLEA